MEALYKQGLRIYFQTVKSGNNAAIFFLPESISEFCNGAGL